MFPSSQSCGAWGVFIVFLKEDRSAKLWKPMASAGTGWPGYVAILWGGPEEQEKRNGRINS